MLAAISISLIIGAGVTSYAEYRFNYNLYDRAKDVVLAVLGFFKKK